MGRNILKPSTIHHLFKIDLAVINSCSDAGIVTLETACMKWNTDDALDFGLSICVVFFGVCVCTWIYVVSLRRPCLSVYSTNSFFWLFFSSYLSLSENMVRINPMINHHFPYKHWPKLATGLSPISVTSISFDIAVNRLFVAAAFEDGTAAVWSACLRSMP